MSGAEQLIDRQRAAATSREREEHYRAVAEGETDAIITIDSNSSTLTVNPASHTCLLTIRLSSNLLKADGFDQTKAMEI